MTASEGDDWVEVLRGAAPGIPNDNVLRHRRRVPNRRSGRPEGPRAELGGQRTESAAPARTEYSRARSPPRTELRSARQSNVAHQHRCFRRGVRCVKGALSAGAPTPLARPALRRPRCPGGRGSRVGLDGRRHARRRRGERQANKRGSMKFGTTIRCSNVKLRPRRRPRSVSRSTTGTRPPGGATASTAGALRATPRELSRGLNKAGPDRRDIHLARLP